MIERTLQVVAIHGEGDRATVNALQLHRNKINGSQDIPDEPPDVIVILRDPHHNWRIEWPVETWQEVEKWKKLAGWDQTKRHWATGAVVKVKLG
jgi:hypothetical protein